MKVEDSLSLPLACPRGSFHTRCCFYCTLVECCCALSAPLCACQTLSTGSSCCEENTSDIDKNRLFFFLVNPCPAPALTCHTGGTQRCTCAGLCTAQPRRRPAERNLSRILALEPVSFCRRRKHSKVQNLRIRVY